MNKSGSNKKASKNTSRKDFKDKYDPVAGYKNQPKSADKRSTDASSNKSDKRQFPDDIPNILKRNIAALSESSESLKLTEFGKSFIEEDIMKSPPRKSNKVLFPKLFSEELGCNNFANKRLNILKNDAQIGLLSSPSIMDSKKSQDSPKLKFPLESGETKSEMMPFNDDFDKLKQTVNNQENSEVDKKISNNEDSSNESDKAQNDTSSEEDKGKSTSNVPNLIKIPDIPELIIKDYKGSLGRFQSMIHAVKNLNEKILVFRKEMCDIISTEFPDVVSQNDK